MDSCDILISKVRCLSIKESTTYTSLLQLFMQHCNHIHCKFNIVTKLKAFAKFINVNETPEVQKSAVGKESKQIC